MGQERHLADKSPRKFQARAGPLSKNAFHVSLWAILQDEKPHPTAIFTNRLRIGNENGRSKCGCVPLNPLDTVEA
jgi:hypothetical protein